MNSWHILQRSRRCCWIPLFIATATAAILLYNNKCNNNYNNTASTLYFGVVYGTSNSHDHVLHLSGGISSTSSIGSDRRNYSFMNRHYHREWKQQQQQQQQQYPKHHHDHDALLLSPQKLLFYLNNNGLITIPNTEETLLTIYHQGMIAHPLQHRTSSSFQYTPSCEAHLTIVSRGGSSSSSLGTCDADDNDVNNKNDDSNDSTTTNTISSHTGNIIGLQNLGSTCYMNAQIQCVYHIPYIRHMILQKYDNNNNNNSNDNEMSPAFIGLQKLFQDMTYASLNNDDCSNNNNAAVTTHTLCHLLGIPLYEQQDTQEFWKLLLPALSIPKLIDLYTGTYENYILALDKSNHERRFLESFLDLSLDVGMDPSSSSTTTTTTATSVMDSLYQQFQQPELLSVAAGNGWRPKSDQPKVDAHKGCSLLQNGLPSILQLHLKRFQFDWNTETTTKLNHPVTFPLILDLSSIVTSSNSNGDEHNNDDVKTIHHNKDDCCIYELQSVIIHVGEYSSGHYYSYVRPNLLTHKDNWYRFNDEIHTKVRFTDVIQDAYGGIVDVSTTWGGDYSSTTTTEESKRGGNRVVRFVRNIFRMDGNNNGGSCGYGFGGPKSSAYVLQYIRRSDIPKLYGVKSD